MRLTAAPGGSAHRIALHGREGWPLDAMGYDAWGRLTAVAYGEADGLDLPGHIRAHVRGQVLQIGPIKADGNAKDRTKGVSKP